MRHILASFVAASALVSTGCATSSMPFVGEKEDAIESNAGYVDAFPETSLRDITLSTRRDIFKSGDMVTVTVYNQDNLSGEYVIDRSGNIMFPLIGTVNVIGLSTGELQQILTERYGAQYLQNPAITVKNDPQKLGRIVVDGAVEKPGVFEIDTLINLSEAIALSEGLSQDASGREIYIVRMVEGSRKIRKVDLREIRRLGAEDPQLIPNDLVFVEESAGRVAFREFLRTVPLLNTAVILTTR